MDHSPFDGEAGAGFGASPVSGRDDAGTGFDRFAAGHSDGATALLADSAGNARSWEDLTGGGGGAAMPDARPGGFTSPGVDDASPDMSVVASGEDLPSLDELLSKLVELDGSDLHLKVGSPPAYRLDGELRFAELRTLTPADTEDFANQVMPEHVRTRFEANNDADFAYGKTTLGRFRVNCYRQRGSISVVLRSVTPVTATFEELGLPPVLERLARAEWGLVIIGGRAGSGKSTTVGSLIDFINTNRRCNIVTLEDPIEILHTDKMSIVSQREIGLDTASYAEGMHRALRQDADVIFMGEMRDLATMEAAMQAAETGKLVITTMLAADTTETVTRIIESFPPFQQKQARYMLAAVLKGILCHRLVPRVDGHGRAPAVESLITNERVHERIIDAEKNHLLLDAVVDGSFYGMQSFDQALIKLYQKKTVTFQDAMAHATDPSDFKLAAQAMGLSTN